ncbi:MAG: protoglobin domain-containing protein, partial [Mariprofundaceae bacterium]
MNSKIEGSLIKKMGMDSAEQEARKAFVDFTSEDVQCLKELAPMIAEHADRIVDGFYDNVERYQHLKDIISNAGSNIERLKSAQKQYLLGLFAGDYGEEYFERRLKIGVIHNQIGLKPRWYLGSYSVYVQLITPLIMKKYRFSPGRTEKALVAMNKIISLDSQLAIDTYIHAVMEDLRSVSLSKDELEETVASYRELVGNVATGD